MAIGPLQRRNSLFKSTAYRVDVEDKHHYSAGLLFVGNQPLALRTDGEKKACTDVSPFFIGSSSNGITKKLPLVSMDPSITNKETKYQIASAPSLSSKIRCKLKSIFYWCQFQKEGWFNKQKIGAEFVNLLSRAGTYASMGAIVGALGGTVACPGLGSAVGAAAGALCGFICGLIVSAVSVIMKPLTSVIIHWLKDKGAKDSESQINQIKSFEENPLEGDLINKSAATKADSSPLLPQTAQRGTDNSERASKLAKLLSNCENKMLHFIYNEWLEKKLIQKSNSGPLSEEDCSQLKEVTQLIQCGNGEHAEMKNLLKECSSSSNALLGDICEGLQDELLSNIRRHLGEKDINGETSNFDGKTCLDRTLVNQFMSYNSTRAPSAGVASQLSFAQLPADVCAALYFPGFALLSAYISGGQGETISKIRKFLTNPKVGAANVMTGGLLTASQFISTLGDAFHDIHTVNPLSFLFTIGIHTVKEYSLAKKDIRIKKEISEFIGHDGNETINIIWKKLARIARHEIVQNIPAALSKLVSLIQRSKEFNPKKDSWQKLVDIHTEANFAVECVRDSVKYIDLYYQRVVKHNKNN